MSSRKKSPLGVVEDEEEDENKYRKKRRRQRGAGQKNHRRLSWSTFGVLYCVGTVLLVWRLASDSATYRSKLLELEKWNRAMRLQRQRNRRHPPNRRKHKDDESNTAEDDGDDGESDGSESADDDEGRIVDDRQTALSELADEVRRIDYDVLHNVAGGIRFIRTHLLPPLPGQSEKATLGKTAKLHYKKLVDGMDPFKATRRGKKMAWLKEDFDENKPPKVDYTKHAYTYPDLMDEPPASGGYPKLETLGDMLTRWPQNNLDNPPSPIVERLLHFNYSNPDERAAALKFRMAELPFKLYDVPEVTEAGVKWTDEYVSKQFDGKHFFLSGGPPRSQGKCQESVNHFFAFFAPPLWQVSTMGAPPTRNNDWSFQMWARHARYADAVGLAEDRPHFYWQAGIPREERYQPKRRWTFVSRDLPSFSSTDETFFCFHPQDQKGIQCRFGERGVTAATHYDSGRNMVAMVTGAKRYILSPPRECSKLGIVTERENSIFRHSLLNFGNMDYLNTDQGKNMSSDEREWLERAKDSLAVDTVLKAGEVMYIPSHWFHYITSVQKSAQCNVRSGVDTAGTEEFGGAEDVRECVESDEVSY